MANESTELISVEQSHQVSQGAQRAETPDEKNLLILFFSPCLGHHK